MTYLLLRVLSAPGQRGVLWPGLLVLAALTAHRGRTWRPVLLVAGALLAVAATVLAIKIGVGRTVPRSGHDLLEAAGRSYLGTPGTKSLAWGSAGRWSRPATSCSDRPGPDHRAHRTQVSGRAVSVGRGGCLGSQAHAGGRDVTSDE